MSAGYFSPIGGDDYDYGDARDELMRREAAEAEQAAADLAAAKSGDGHCPALARSGFFGVRDYAPEVGEKSAENSAGAFAAALEMRELADSLRSLPGAGRWEEQINGLAEGREFCRRNYPGAFTRRAGEEWDAFMASAKKPVIPANNPFAALAALKKM